MEAMDISVTKLEYYEDMSKLESSANFVSLIKVQEDDRKALILDRTIFHPQGGGQPADTGTIVFPDSDLKFVVQDVRSKEGTVMHYGYIENSNEESESRLCKGQDVLLYVDELRRKLNSRLHSAGHLLDICMENVGWGYLEPGKGYHFPDGPYVEYKGIVPPNEVQAKQKLLELEASSLISDGGKVSTKLLPYEEAAAMCGGCLPDYIPKGSTPRIVKLGNYPGCPCGGTHVSDISEIINLKITRIRMKKGMTKVFYEVADP